MKTGTREWGGTFVSYFEGAEYILKYQKFGEDDMLQEGFNEAVEKGEIAIRIVDKLNAGSYNESVIEDGVLYLQVCTFLYFSATHHISVTGG